MVNVNVSFDIHIHDIHIQKKKKRPPLRRVSSSQKMVKNRPRFIYKTELAAIHKTSSTHSRQMFQALQRLN